MNKFRSLLLIALVWIGATNMKALEAKEGVYQIGTAEDLAAFAELVKGGEKTADAVLTADIDFSGYQTMIGNSDILYAGTFDGAYHTVTVGYSEPESDYTALFQYVSGTVKNLRVNGTIASGKKYAAGIVGNLNGGTVDGCISAVTINSSVDGDATHGGIAGIGTNSATIQNSISAVTIRGELTTNCGGIVGWLSGATALNNNLQIADIEIKQESGSATMCRNAGNQKGGNNYYLTNYGTKDNNATQITEEQLKSGEVCYRLNGNNDAIRFYQTIGEDELPVLDPTHAQVYAQGDVRCDGKAASGELTYSNTFSEKPAHDYHGGFCSVCGLAQADFLQISEDGFYLIGNIEQMEWFATQVNSGNNAIKGRLTASLNYDGYDYTTIGSTGNYYKGTFDGGHFPILNVEAMLFGSIDGATIENVDLRGGTIKANSTYASHTGTIVGNAGVSSNKSTIRNCSSTADLLNVSTDAGGICGKLTGTIENCYYGGNLIDCTSTSGGILGSSNNVYTVIRNCLVTSTTITGNASYLGNFVGYFHGGSVLSNSFVLETTGISNMAGNNGGSTTDTEIVSADRLASGEIAYILNEKQSEKVAFYQTIGEDALPVLDPSHKVVYANGALNCDGSPLGGELAYSNSETSTRPDHQFENGLCVNCGYFDVNYASTDADGYYLIDSPAKLEWYSAMVGKGNADIKARQTADIDLDGINHTPIGNKSVMYTGTYDGQGYTIDNLNNMFCGTINGATLKNIHILGGDIQANTDIAAHVGTLAGASGTAKANTISNCGSLASISGASCDAGGLVGKMYGTISNCYFGGNLDCTSTTGGMVGSSYDADHAATISNCVVYSTTLNGNASYLGRYVGYFHENCAVNNCYAFTPVDKDAGHNGGSASGNKTFTEEQSTSGELTWTLNGKSFINPTWYQTPGEDMGPVQIASHGLVYKVADGEYACQTDDASLKTMVTFLATNARDFGTEAVAQKSLKDEYMAAAAVLNTEITTRAQLMEIYAAVEPLRKKVEASEEAYKAYEAKVLEILAYMNEHEDIAGPWKELLMDYLEAELEPSEDMPNGSSMYILQTLELDEAQVTAEAAFAQHLMEAAIANDIKPGSEITNLLTNANFADGYNGWQGKKGTSTGGVKEVMTVGETWNATMDMYQTLTDMPDGIYELQAYAAYRPYATPASTQQASVLYANNNKVYVSNVIEDMVKVEDAIDQVNCYITEGGSNPDYEITDVEGNVTGYVMHGLNSASYGFSAGRHLNHIVVNVTDGVVKVGLNTMGSGQSSDWTAFADFRLFYRGSIEESTEALDRTLADQVARANTLLNNYEPLIDENYPKYPNYSAALRSELEAAVAAVETAANGEEKYALIEKFSQLFQDIYDCKMAYVKLLQKMELVDAKLWELNENGGVTPEVIAEEKAANTAVWNGYIDGTYSLEEALAQKDILSLEIYKTVFGEEPEQIDGVYQIASGRNLRWFQLSVNEGNTLLKAVQTAPIDMNTVSVDPIGTPTYKFAGSYDGQFFPLYNIKCMLFGTVNGATITRVAIESGTVTMNTNYAAHTGTIVGAVGTDLPNSLTLSYSKADVVDCSTDAGGLVGKYYGLVENCYYAGNMTCTSTTGGIIGSSYDGSYVPEVKNCHVYSQVIEGNATYLGVFAGYIHGGSYLQNLYGIEGVTPKIGGTMNGSNVNLNTYSADQFASGEVAYLMNQNNEEENIWRQTLGQDLYPVLYGNHDIVVKNEDGTYGNITAVQSIQNNTTERVNVFDMQGRVIRRNVTRANSLINLPKGIYIVGDRKVAK